MFGGFAFGRGTDVGGRRRGRRAYERAAILAPAIESCGPRRAILFDRSTQELDTGVGIARRVARNVNRMRRERAIEPELGDAVIAPFRGLIQSHRAAGVHLRVVYLTLFLDAFSEVFFY